MKRGIVIIAFSLVFLSGKAQTGIGTTTPNASAKLDVFATDKGLLPPRVTLTSGSDTTTISSPATGLLIYNTGNNVALQAGYYYWNGSSWATIATVLGSSQNSAGDIKSGIQQTDHNGWIKLDGRPKSSLSASQQARATALGIGVDLPNASNAVLMQNGTTLGSVSGSNNKTIALANLPNVTLTGTTSVDGSHTHTIKVNSNGVTFVSGGTVTAMAEANNNWTAGATVSNANVINDSGNHSHTFTTSSINGGVTQTFLDITPQSLSVNTFIYLGF